MKAVPGSAGERGCCSLRGLVAIAAFHYLRPILLCASYVAEQHVQIGPAERKHIPPFRGSN